jgi:AhpD family alkylhydroperoxidase
MTPSIPAGRMQLAEVAPRQYGAMSRLSESVALDHGLRRLLELRASEINGCAFWLDMHWKDARAAGETEERLYMLSAWRESKLYDAGERAALALCEAMTQIARTHVPDEVWDRAEAAFSEEELSQAVFASP